MAKTKAQRYLGGITPFGTIISVEDRVYNAEATVEAKDGSTRAYRLPFLIAHGLTLPEKEEQLCQSAPPDSPSGSHSAADPRTPSQRRADYDLLLNGEVVGDVYFNMTGYVGTLPQPDGTGFTPGETGISAYRTEIARINREARSSSRS